MDLLQSYGDKSDEEGGEESRREEGEEKGKVGGKVEAAVAPASPDSDSSSSPPRILQAKSAAPRVDDTALGVEVGRVGAGGEEVLDPGGVSGNGRLAEELLRFLLHSLRRPAKARGGGGWGEAVGAERKRRRRRTARKEKDSRTRGPVRLDRPVTVLPVLSGRTQIGLGEPSNGQTLIGHCLYKARGTKNNEREESSVREGRTKNVETRQRGKNKNVETRQRGKNKNVETRRRGKNKAAREEQEQRERGIKRERGKNQER